MTPVRHTFETRSALADGLADTVAGWLRDALRTGGKTSIAVPGGTTPGPFLIALSKADLDWPNVVVTLTDERWVPPSHERSNQRLLDETLFSDRGAAAKFVPLFNGGATPEDGLAEVDAALHAEALPLDICILGMGADMHTASLFPGADMLENALGDDAPPIMAIRAPGASEPRVTLTAPTLRQSEHIALLITGKEKADALKIALTDGPVADAPVRAVLQGPRRVEVFYAP